jgi:LuxR family transcriptional regulator, maltose regulon positive regulatory protein
MAEPPAAAPGGCFRADVLLATKLHMPRLEPELVARLDKGLARGLVLVCAPAGFGKTVLVAG